MIENPFMGHKTPVVAGRNFLSATQLATSHSRRRNTGVWLISHVAKLQTHHGFAMNYV
jgi:hypothetical protein